MSVDTEGVYTGPEKIRINFSTEEASSEARDFTPLPTGKYNVFITDGEIRASKSEKNKGKPYWALEMTISDGPYEGRKLWANVMLWAGAAYSLAQLLKAIGREDALTSGEVPGLDEVIGQQIKVNAKKEVDTYAMNKAKEAGEQNPERTYRTEVKGFLKYDGEASTATAAGSSAKSSGSNSLLP